MADASRHGAPFGADGQDADYTVPWGESLRRPSPGKSSPPPAAESPQASAGEAPGWPPAASSTPEWAPPPAPQPPPAAPAPGAYPQSQGYPPPGAYPQYGAYPPPYYVPVPQAPQTETMAIVSLVLALAGTFVFPVGAHIAALILAPMAKKNIRASGGRLTGEGMATAAQVVSWIILAFSILFVLAYIALIVFAVSQSSSTTS